MTLPLADRILSDADVEAPCDQVPTHFAGIDPDWPLFAYPVSVPVVKEVRGWKFPLLELSCGHFVNPVSAYCAFCGAKVIQAKVANPVVYNDGCYSSPDYSAVMLASENRDVLERWDEVPLGWNGPDGTDAQHRIVPAVPLRMLARLHLFDNADGEACAGIYLHLRDDSEGGVAYVELCRFLEEDRKSVV